MSDLSQTGSISEFGKLTGNTATTIFTASGATRIQSITACENTGAATPTLSIETYDGTSVSYYKRRAVAMTAGTEIVFNEPFSINPGWQIRLTSGDAAGKVDWCITYDTPTAAGRLRAGGG
jgi:hypothetical protein